jgi:hypothetical protein
MKISFFRNFLILQTIDKLTKIAQVLYPCRNVPLYSYFSAIFTVYMFLNLKKS